MAVSYEEQDHEDSVAGDDKRAGGYAPPVNVTAAQRFYRKARMEWVTAPVVHHTFANLSEGAFERAEEVAASVAALTARMETHFQWHDVMHEVDEERRNTFENRLDWDSGWIKGHDSLHFGKAAPPPPEADEPARLPQAYEPGDLVMIGPWRVIHNVEGFPGMAVDIQQDQRGHEIRIDGILRKNVHPYERAAAAPTPTRTISRDRLNELVDRWFSEPTDSFQNRMTDVLQELGHEVEP